jgi:hypothetical protein
MIDQGKAEAKASAFFINLYSLPRLYITERKFPTFS